MNAPLPPPPPTQGLRRWLYMILGLFFLLLAILGALLPVLPSTPFVLLASASFVRSSPRLHRWLLGSRWFGPMLYDWHRYRGVRRRVKVLAIGLILVTIAASLYFGNLAWPLMILVGILALIGMTVVLRLPTVPIDNGAASADWEGNAMVSRQNGQPAQETSDDSGQVESARFAARRESSVEQSGAELPPRGETEASKNGIS